MSGTRVSFRYARVAFFATLAICLHNLEAQVDQPGDGEDAAGPERSGSVLRSARSSSEKIEPVARVASAEMSDDSSRSPSTSQGRAPSTSNLRFVRQKLLEREQGRKTGIKVVTVRRRAVSRAAEDWGDEPAVEVPFLCPSLLHDSDAR